MIIHANVFRAGGNRDAFDTRQFCCVHDRHQFIGPGSGIGNDNQSGARGIQNVRSKAALKLVQGHWFTPMIDGAPGADTDAHAAPVDGSRMHRPWPIHTDAGFLYEGGSDDKKDQENKRQIDQRCNVDAGRRILRFSSLSNRVKHETCTSLLY